MEPIKFLVWEMLHKILVKKWRCKSLVITFRTWRLWWLKIREPVIQACQTLLQLPLLMWPTVNSSVPQCSSCRSHLDPLVFSLDHFHHLVWPHSKVTMRTFAKFWVLLWKNLLLKRRHWFMTILEIAVPVLLFVVLAVVRGQINVVEETYVELEKLETYQVCSDLLRNIFLTRNLIWFQKYSMTKLSKAKPIYSYVDFKVHWIQRLASPQSSSTQHQVKRN